MKRFQFQAFFKKMRGRSFFEASKNAEDVSSSSDSINTDESLSDEVDEKAVFPSQILRDDYFLVGQCERLTCGHSVQQANYNFCPKCGYTAVPVYDYYRLFGLVVNKEGLFSEELLKKNFRELSKYYHPDAQPTPDSTSTAEAPHFDQLSEANRHENFSFLSTALETLKNPVTRVAYHKQYMQALQELFPEKSVEMEALSEKAESNEVVASKPVFSFQALWKRCVVLSVTFLDFLVTLFIAFLVIKAYLWGAVLSLIGAWFYFRKTRQFLNRLYS